MTPPIERRVTLRKAPVNDDVVADLVNHVSAPVAAVVLPAPAAPDEQVTGLGESQAPAPAKVARKARSGAVPPAPAEQVAPEPDPVVVTTPGTTVHVVASAGSGEVLLARRGPGRPRSRRRMEPFSSKLEIGLRDRLDGYLASTGESIVDFLDRAVRNEIAQSQFDAATSEEGDPGE